MAHAWMENGEVAFEAGFLNIMEDDREAFAKGHRGKHIMQEALEGQMPVGIVFLPKGRHLYHKPERAAAVTSFGLAGIVPEQIKLVLFVGIAEGWGKQKYDIRRKMLAYHPKNMILLDLAFRGDALYGASDIAYDGSWRISERIAAPKDTAHMRARALRGILGIEDALLRELSCLSYGIRMFLDELKQGGVAEPSEELIDYFASLRQLSRDEASHIMSMLSCGRISEIGFRELSREALAELAADARAKTGFASWNRAWIAGKEGWYIDEDFGSEDNTSKALNMLDALYIDPRDAEYARHINELRGQAERLREIWEHLLRQQRCPVILPGNICRDDATPEQRALARDTMELIAKGYCIDSAVEAYLSGVPIEDIFA